MAGVPGDFGAEPVAPCLLYGEARCWTTRIGIDDMDEFQDLQDFVGEVPRSVINLQARPPNFWI